MNSPAQICNDIALRLVLALMLLAAVPLGVVGLTLIRAIEAIGDSRAWAAFARFWWGRPAHG